jgi:hypothetical protein
MGRDGDRGVVLKSEEQIREEVADGIAFSTGYVAMSMPIKNQTGHSPRSKDLAINASSPTAPRLRHGESQRFGCRAQTPVPTP